MARTSYLDKYPELRDLVAIRYHEGASNQAIADSVNAEFSALNVHHDTVITWRKDDEIQAKIRRLARERIVRITRLVDSELLQRLDKMATKMDTDELIKLRKEFVPNVESLGEEKQDKSDIVEEIFGAASEDPELAEKLAGIADGDKR